MKVLFSKYSRCLFICIILAGCSETGRPLPKPLYYIDGSNETSQVWRLERDGIHRKQITNEPMGVDSFRVSSQGVVALISDNKLFLMDTNGKNGRLIADGDTVVATGEDAYFNKSVAGLSFSPDGQTLAYGLSGIHLYSILTGEDEHVLFNLDNLLNEPFVFVKEVYTPGAWSPDGSRLIITMGYYEGSTLAVMEPEAPQPFTRLKSDGAVCCLFTWSADSRYVLVANPWFSGTIPGLWQFDAYNGAQTLFLPGHSRGKSLTFIGWPYQNSKGELSFFRSYNPDLIPPQDALFSLVLSDANAIDPDEVGKKEFSIREGLWAPDGSRVLIVGSYEEKEEGLFLINPSKDAIQCLVEDGSHVRNLVWGP